MRIIDSCRANLQRRARIEGFVSLTSPLSRAMAAVMTLKIDPNS